MMSFLALLSMTVLAPEALAYSPQDYALLPEACAPSRAAPDAACQHMGFNKSPLKYCYRSDNRIRRYVIDPGDAETFSTIQSELNPGQSLTDAWTAAVIHAADQWNHQTQVGTFQFEGIVKDATLAEDAASCPKEPQSIVTFVNDCSRETKHASYGYTYPRCVDDDGVAQAFEIHLYRCINEGQEILDWRLKPGAEGMDANATLVHEFGHTLNLAHRSEHPRDLHTVMRKSSVPITDDRPWQATSRLVGDRGIGEADIECVNAFLQPRENQVQSAWHIDGNLGALTSANTDPVSLGTWSQEIDWWGQYSDRELCGGPQHMALFDSSSCIESSPADRDDSIGLAAVDTWQHRATKSAKGWVYLADLATKDAYAAQKGVGELTFGPRAFWSSMTTVPVPGTSYGPMDPMTPEFPAYPQDLGHPVLVGRAEVGNAKPLNTCEWWSNGCLSWEPVLSGHRVAVGSFQDTPIVSWVNQQPGGDENKEVRVSVGSYYDTLLGAARAVDGQASNVGPGLVCDETAGEGYDCVLAVADADDPLSTIVLRRFDVDVDSGTLTVDPVQYRLPFEFATSSDIALWTHQGELFIAFRSMFSGQGVYAFSLSDFDSIRGEIGGKYVGAFGAPSTGPAGVSDNSWDVGALVTTQ